jgi:16S rRNA (guanine527-N7)-methyltransferase
MLEQILLSRAAAMGLPMTEAQAAQFARYHAMLVAANARMNLTRVPDDPAEAADRNYLDCVAALAGDFPAAETAVDVGSGAGFPGIPLSICLPDVHFTLMDALGKRVDFLKSVIDALDLNAEAVHLRAEDGARKPELRESFDIATARAVTRLDALCELCLPMVKKGGAFVAMKGPAAAEELKEAEKAIKILGGKLEKIHEYTLPDTDVTHTAVVIRKVGTTPKQYPRSWGKIKKSPIR